MHFDRRAFLRRSLHTALGGVALTSTFGSLKAMAAAAHVNGTPTNFRALVCVFQHGGNDSFNSIVPISTPHHGIYSAARPALAVPQAQAA